MGQSPVPVYAQFDDTQKDQIRSWHEQGKTQQEIADLLRVPRRTAMKLCQHLGLGRTAKEAAQLKAPVDDPDLVDRVRTLRPTHSLPQLVALTGVPLSTLQRLCVRNSIPKPDDYAVQQATRMKAAWTQEKRTKAAQAANALVTEDLRRRLSESSKAMWQDKDYRDNQVAVQRLVWSDQGIRQRMADLLKDYWDNTDRRLAMAEVQRLVWTADRRQVMSKLQTKLWQDPEKRIKFSQLLKKMWESEDFRAQMALTRTTQLQVSNIQIQLYSMLDDLGVQYYREHNDRPSDIECTVGPYSFDCVIPRPGRASLLIECQGDYWHSLQRAVRNDKSKSTYIKLYHSDTYELKQLWEHEFSCPDRVLSTLKYWLGVEQPDAVDFEFTDLEIKPCPAAEYRPLLAKYHYLAAAERHGRAWGIYHGDRLVGVVSFSPPVRQNVDCMEFDRPQVVELSRLCIHPAYQRQNLASWFVSRAMKLLPPEIRCIISYCDTTFNHDGAVYKALNFAQDRVIRPDYWYECAGGWVMHKKTLYQKAVRMSVKEAEYAERFGYRKVFGSDKLRFVYRR